jgi:Bacterial PH domain
VSTQQEPARQGDGATGGGPADVGPGPPSGPAQQGTTKVFRLPGPVVFWWVWVVFAVANLVDLAIQGHDRTSFQIAVGLAAVTGVVYVCALRPRVSTDAAGLTVQNPVRDYRVPWGRVDEIYLGESVQVRCSPGETFGGKLVHSWALYSPRRSRLKSEVRGRRWDRNPSSRPGGYARLPAEAREVAKQHPGEVMAREIQGQAARARQRGAAGGQVVASWAWPAVAAVVVPALALVLVIVIR